MIIAANSPSPMRVAFLRHRKPAGYRIAMRAGDIDPRETLPRAGILSIAINLPANQSAPVFSPLGRVIAAAHSLGSEVLARAIERTRTPIALARANISTRVGLRRLICNLRGNPTASRKLPFSRFLRAFRVLQDFARQGTDLLHYNQTLSFVPTNHAHKKAWSYQHVAHENSVKGA